MKVVDFQILEKVSKSKNKYTALYAITDTGKEIFICFVSNH